jgi:NTP pyrophosphatase (non-canonical NTP hydrolase)
MFDDIRRITAWLDVMSGLRDNPLADDMSRVMKIGEELGETVEAFIGYTGQNPRKGFSHTKEQMLAELADVVITALCAIQHFTQDETETETIITGKILGIIARSPEIERIDHHA